MTSLSQGIRSVVYSSLKGCGRLCIVNVPFTTRAMTTKIPVPEKLLLPAKIPKRLLLGPGPANISPAVTTALTQPMLGYLHPEFLEVMHDVKVGLQYVFQTKNRVTLAISGTGHAGMEASLANLIEPGDKVLIAQHGLWGLRAADMSERLGANVAKITKPPGQGFTLQEIEQALEQHKPVLFFICHGESSTGVRQPLEGLSEACHKHNCLLLVDTVASLGGSSDIRTDELGIDAIYSATQKALGCPPGLAPLSFGERAMKKYFNRKTKPVSFYFDIGLVGNYWGCFDEPIRYHHTGPISSIYALREGLAAIVKEGLEETIVRHHRSAAILADGLQQLGLELFVKDKNYRLPTLTTIEVPSNVNWKEVVDYLNKVHSIEIAGGLGETVGKIWRIGLFGHNSTEDNVKLVLSCLKEALNIVSSNENSKQVVASASA